MNFKQKIRQALCFFLACQLFIITAYAKPAWPSDTGIQAEAGIVIDAGSSAVLFGQNIHVPYPPASITKLLTALIVLEHAKLTDTVDFTESAMYSVEADSGNKQSLAVGDRLTVEDCLYLLLLVSSNHAANALAEHVAGSLPAFVDMMNDKLRELGCTESHFDNPSGLNGDTQYVTAYDMALIAQAAYSNETLLAINSDLTHTIAPTANNPEGLTIKTEHRLLYTDDPASSYYCPEAIAGKTGYLLKAGNTLVTCAEKDGRRLIAVVLKGKPYQYFKDSKELLDFGFRSFQNLSVADNETNYVTGDTPLELDGVTYKPSDLTVEPGRYLTLPAGAAFTDATMAMEAVPDNRPAGAVALLTYTYDDRAVGQAFLLSKNDVAIDAGADGDGAGKDGIGDGDSGGAGSGKDGDASKDAAKKSGPRSLLTTLAAVFIFLVIAAVAGGIAWIIYSRKKEAEALARRRERRRQRLKAAGEEEEFEKLLGERMKR